MNRGSWGSRVTGSALLALLWVSGPAHADFEIREEWVDQTVQARDGGSWLAKHDSVLFGTQSIYQACVGRRPPNGAKVYYHCFGQGVLGPATHGEAVNTARIQRLTAVDGGVLVVANVGWQAGNGSCACYPWLFRMDDDGSVRWSQMLSPTLTGQARVTDMGHRPGDADAYLAAVIAEPSPTPWDPRSVRAQSVVSRVDVSNGQIIDSLRLDRKEVWWPASPSFPEYSSTMMFQIFALRVDPNGEVVVGGVNYFHLSDPWAGSFDRHSASTYAFAARIDAGERQLRHAWRARYQPASDTPYRRDLAVELLAPGADQSQVASLVSTETGDSFGPQFDLVMLDAGGNLSWRRTLDRERWQRRQIHALVRAPDGGVVASVSRTNLPAPMVSTAASIESFGVAGQLRARIESTLPQDTATINRTYHSGLDLRGDGSGDVAIGSLWLGNGRYAHDEIHAKSGTLKHFSCSWTRPSLAGSEIGPTQWATPVFRNFTPQLVKGNWLVASPLPLPMQSHVSRVTQRICP